MTVSRPTVDDWWAFVEQCGRLVMEWAQGHRVERPLMEQVKAAGWSPPVLKVK